MSQSLIYIDVPGFQPLPPADVLKIAGEGTQVHTAKDENDALTILDRLKDVKIVLANAPTYKVFAKARANHPIELFARAYGWMEQEP